MVLSNEERLTVLLAELKALQDRFIKYDDLVWKSRSWAIALVAAFLGWAVAEHDSTIDRGDLLLLAAFVPVLFWLQEGLLRLAYVYKFVSRYRRLRDVVNESTATLEAVPIYDLTSHVEGRGCGLDRLRFAFLRSEQIVFYLSLSVAPLALFCMQ